MKWSDCKYAVLVVLQNELTEKYFFYPLIATFPASACAEAAGYRGDMIAVVDQFGKYYPIKK